MFDGPIHFSAPAVVVRNPTVITSTHGVWRRAANWSAANLGLAFRAASIRRVIYLLQVLLPH